MDSNIIEWKQRSSQLKLDITESDRVESNEPDKQIGKWGCHATLDTVLEWLLKEHIDFEDFN